MDILGNELIYTEFKALLPLPHFVFDFKLSC